MEVIKFPLILGPRVDNARLIPGFPPGGLCGTIRSSADFPNLRSFKTTQNELTVQFVTDNKKDSKAGFKLRIRQYPYSNPGNLYPDGSNPGGIVMNTSDSFIINVIKIK